ncbi:Cro/CI family transcriptional regulator [Pseudomonas aeruginosa]|nr:Cro/Cl family transcriptional regulator [Pseudomonas aeruginosa]
MTKTQVISHFRGVSKVAKALNITYEAVRQWPEEIPKLRQYEIERITKGALKVATEQSAA